MHHRLDGVLVQHLGDELAVGRVADDERRAEHRAAVAGGEIVEDDDAFAALGELTDDVTADVAGTAGDEDRGHASMLSGNSVPFTDFRGESENQIRGHSPF